MKRSSAHGHVDEMSERLSLHQHGSIAGKPHHILTDSLLDMADGLKKSWNCSVGCNTLHESIVGAHASTTCKSQLITVLFVAGCATLAAFQGVATSRNAV